VDSAQLENSMNVYHYNSNIDGAQDAPFITYLIQTLYNPIIDANLIGLLYDNVIPNLSGFDITIDNVELHNQRGSRNSLGLDGIHILGRTDHTALEKLQSNFNSKSVYVFYDLEGELLNDKFYSNLIKDSTLTNNVFVFTDRYYFNSDIHSNIFFDFKLKLKFSLAYGFSHDMNRFGFNYEKFITKPNRFYLHTRRIAQTKLNVYEHLFNHKELLTDYNNKFLISFTDYTFKKLPKNTKEELIINSFKAFSNFHIEKESDIFSVPLMDDKTNCTLKKIFQIDVLGQIPVYLETSDFSDSKLTETNYFTEKTINYLFQKRPFLCLTRHINDTLSKLGYYTFENEFGIDTSLSDEKYYTKIFEKIKEMCILDETEYQRFYSNLKIKAEENYIKIISDLNSEPLINKILNKLK
jgi:hypothetical protein